MRLVTTGSNQAFSEMQKSNIDIKTPFVFHMKKKVMRVLSDMRAIDDRISVWSKRSVLRCDSIRNAKFIHDFHKSVLDNLSKVKKNLEAALKIHLFHKSYVAQHIQITLNRNDAFLLTWFEPCCKEVLSVWSCSL